MTQDIEISAFNNVMAILTESGFDGMADAMAVLMNEAMKLDRGYHLCRPMGAFKNTLWLCQWLQTQAGTNPHRHIAFTDSTNARHRLLSKESLKNL